MSPPKGYKKTGSTDDAKKIMRSASRGEYWKFCPITNNLPTRMTRRAFTDLCQRHQESETGNYCNQACFGKKLPAGLEFIATPTKQEEDENMTTRPAVTGKCSLCGERKQVRILYEKSSCPTCENIRRAAKNSPELMVTALLEMAGQAWVDKNFTISTDENDQVVTELQSAKEQMQTRFTENIVMQEKLDEYARMFDAFAKEKEGLEDEISKLHEILDQKMFNSSPILQGNLDQTFIRDSCLLDLALDVIDGKVSGIDSNKLRALR